jgi:hypothetical protein
MSLLQGLMDGDGSIVKKRGRCLFDNTNKILIDDIIELIRSLGIKTYSPTVIKKHSQIIKDKTYNHKEIYKISFTTHKRVFRLMRKAKYLNCKKNYQHTYLYIKDIKEIKNQNAYCISVDSVDGSYLVGQFIPTHNTGSGKTFASLFLALQFVKLGSNLVFIDPKRGSDFSNFALNNGWDVHSLDDLTKADGVFDPLRFNEDSHEVKLKLAVSSLTQINFWGKELPKFEIEIQSALDYGIRTGGKTTIGSALKFAYEHGKASKELVDPIIKQAKTDAQFSAICGIDESAKGLGNLSGGHLIMVGNTYLDISTLPFKEQSLSQRISAVLLKMMIYSSTYAVQDKKKGGVVMFDEAHIFFKGGKDEMDMLGRCARSQNVLPVMLTQKVSDATSIGLKGYFSRYIMLHLDDDEAPHAFELAKMEATDTRIDRMTAKSSIADINSTTGEGLNWASQQALIETNKYGDKIIKRGSIALVKDLSDRSVYVEVKVPKIIFDQISTNPEDIQNRKEKQDASIKK